MNSYKVKGIILAVIISLASIMMPFSVYADTITNSNVNINYYLESVTEVSSGSYLQTYKVDFVFDKSYLGWISSKLVGTYISNNTLPTTTSQFTITKAIYVNGSIASTTVSFTTPNTISNGALQSLSQNIQNSNVTPLSDLSTLDDILNVLSDINNNIEIDVLDELQSIVANTSLSNTYLNTLTQLRQYNFPFESFLFNYYLMNVRGYDVLDIVDNYYYQYPIYNVPNNGIVETRFINAGQSYYFIVGVDKTINNVSELSNVFTISSGTFSDLQQLYVTNGYRIVKFRVINSNAGTFTIKAAANLKLMAILSLRSDYYDKHLFSTDFALLYSLPNRLLDNIQTIANGTSQSNSAASDLESEASEYSDIADDVIGVEEGLTSNFETEVNKIDLNTGLNGFGGNFMTSATWVRTQFDRLTENTPYGSLVVYGLTLGFVLLMLGKVLL